MKKQILLIFLCLCTLAANADVFTDGIRKRVDDGQITITIAKDPVLQDIFDRSYDQMRDGMIEYIASLFRQNMSEKEFKEWMAYKPSQKELDYENNVKNFRDGIEKPLTSLISTDSIAALLAAGKYVEIIEAKPCSASFKQAYDHFAKVNYLDMIVEMQKMVANFGQSISDSTGLDPLAQRAWNIWENNTKNTLQNAYLTGSTEKQLKEYSKELPFDKSMHIITVQFSSNLANIFLAAYGVPISEFENIIDKKHDALVEKYPDLKGREVDFNVGANGIKRAY